MTTAASALILTNNEETDIGACLRLLHWSDDIHVFDSYSSDKTVEVARAAGAKVTQRRFDNYASQRNAGLHEPSFKYDWVLVVDADERIPQALAEEIRAFLQQPPADVVACRIRRRDYFLGRWLKHAAISQYYVRLVRPEKVRYVREVNEILQVDGAIQELKEPFDHYPFSKGFSHWISKHNVYSTMEAELIIRSRAGRQTFSFWKLFARDFNERRYHQKELFYKLPARPLLKWMYMIFVRRAFLDGRAGIAYTFLQSIYEYMIVLKTKELERKERIVPRDFN